MPIVRIQDKLPTCLIIFSSRPTISCSLQTTLRHTDTILRFLSFHVPVSFRPLVLKPEYTYTWKYTKKYSVYGMNSLDVLLHFMILILSPTSFQGVDDRVSITPFSFVCFLVSFPFPFRIHIYTSFLDRLLDISICYFYLHCVHWMSNSPRHISSLC